MKVFLKMCRRFNENVFSAIYLRKNIVLGNRSLLHNLNTFKYWHSVSIFKVNKKVDRLIISFLSGHIFVQILLNLKMFKIVSFEKLFRFVCFVTFVLCSNSQQLFV